MTCTIWTGVAANVSLSTYPDVDVEVADDVLAKVEVVIVDVVLVIVNVAAVAGGARIV
jgi:hypothetical protein